MSKRKPEEPKKQIPVPKNLEPSDGERCGGIDGPSNDCCVGHGCIIPLLYMIVAFLVGLAVGHGCK